MNDYFRKFHAALYPHILNVKQGSNENVYNDLFKWTITDKEGEPKYSGAQIARWISGKEKMPSKIRLQAMANMEEALDNYAGCFYELFNEKELVSNQSFEMLDCTMTRFLEIFPISLCPPDIEQKQMNRDFPASIALVTALIYDEIAYDAASKKGRHIETGLYMALLDVLETCKSSNVRFSGCHLLSVLFQPGYPLLYAALNDVQDGLGEKWAKKIDAYVNAGNHKPYVETSLGEQEIIFLSQVLAFRNHNRDAVLPVDATEETVCHVLPLCRQSGTLAALWSDIAACGLDAAQWERLVQDCQTRLYKTTIDFSRD